MRVRHVARGEDRERGAVLIELAIVSMVLTVLLAGAFDYGMGWRTGLAVNEAARTGARVGSGMGPAKEADFRLLSGLRSALSSSGQLDGLQRVVIYSASRSDGAVPSGCKSGIGTSNDKCNIISGDALRGMPTAVGTTLESHGCLKTATTKRWCPTGRINVQLEAQYIGVWVQTDYDYQFGLLGSSLTIERETVMRLEPKEF